MDKESILKDIQSKAHLWKNLEPKNISIKKLPDLTNVVFRVKVETGNVKKGQPKKLIYKTFNDKTEMKAIIDRKQETEILKASNDAKLGPKLFFVDEFLQIEESIEAQDYTNKDMLDSKRQMVLMYTLSLFQKLKPNISREDIFGKLVVSGIFHNLVEQKVKEMEYDSNELKFITNFEEFASQSRILNLYEAMNKEKLPFVLSHNFLQHGNIMKHREKFSKLSLFDFEYSGFNFMGFDIANYCNECMFDYSESPMPGFVLTKAHRPSGLRLRDLLRYLIFFTNIQESKINENLLDPTILEDEWSKNSKLEDQFNDMIALHNTFLIASHIIWIYWAILNSKGPNKKFDYMEYARQRLEDAQELAGANTVCNIY